MASRKHKVARKLVAIMRGDNARLVGEGVRLDIENMEGRLKSKGETPRRNGSGKYNTEMRLSLEGI